MKRKDKIETFNVAITSLCSSNCLHCIACSGRHSNEHLHPKEYERFVEALEDYFVTEGAGLEIGRIGDALLSNSFPKIVEVSIDHDIGKGYLGVAPAIPPNDTVAKRHEENLREISSLRDYIDEVDLDITIHPFYSGDKQHHMWKNAGKEICMWSKYFFPDTILLHLLALPDDVARDIGREEYGIGALGEELKKSGAMEQILGCVKHIQEEEFYLTPDGQRFVILKAKTWEGNEVEIIIDRHTDIIPLGRARSIFPKDYEYKALDNFPKVCSYWGSSSLICINPDGKVGLCDYLLLSAPDFSQYHITHITHPEAPQQLKETIEIEKRIKKGFQNTGTPCCRLFLCLYLNHENYYEVLTSFSSY